MKRLLLIAAFLIALCVPASAQFNGCSAGFCAPKSTAVSYSGLADINGTPAGFWGLRAMSAALAVTTTSLADMVASGTPFASVCTLRASSTGIDLSASYCAGTTPALACAAATGGSCVVSKLYDQSGAGNHLIQATQANRPPITFNTFNGNPVLGITSNSFLLFGGSLTVAQPFTVAVAAEQTVSTGIISNIFDDNNTEKLEFNATSGLWSMLSGASRATFSATISTIHSAQALYNAASSSAYVDGTLTSSLTVGATSFGTLPVAGRGGSGGATGFYSEIAIWSGDKSANYATVCHNQRLFWGSAGSC